MMMIGVSEGMEIELSTERPHAASFHLPDPTRSNNSIAVCPPVSIAALFCGMDAYQAFRWLCYHHQIISQ